MKAGPAQLLDRSFRAGSSGFCVAGALAIVAGFLVVASAADARAEGPSVTHKSGAVRVYGAGIKTAAIRGADAQVVAGDELDWMAGSVLRGMAKGSLGGSSGDGGTGTFRWSTNAFVDVSRVPGGGDSGALQTVGGRVTPYRNKWLSWQGRDGGQSLTAGVDRLFVQHILGDFTTAVGRMPVNLSVTSLFTPNDLFAPFSAAAINRMYKPGVDALRLSLATGTLGNVELIAVMGSTTDGALNLDTSAALARLAFVAGDFQLIGLGGRVAGRYLLGAGLQGDVGPANLRAEGHVGKWDEGTLARANGDGLHARGSVGMDLTLPWRNASALAEVMYVSDGANEPASYLLRAVRMGPDEQPNLGKYYGAVAVGAELLPIVRVQLFAMSNLADLSGLGGLSGSWNIADEMDAVLGLYLPWGDGALVTATGMVPGSEFGLAGRTLYAEVRAFF